MTVDLRWAPFLTVLEREVKRFLKVIFQTIFTPLINSTLYLLIFGVSLGSHIKLESGRSYLAFLIPGLVMMGCLNNAFQNSSSSVITAKFGGDLEDFRVSPLSHFQIVWAMSFGGLIRGITVGFLTYMTGLVFIFFTEGNWLSISHPLALLFFVAVGGLSFAKLGICVAFWARSFDQLGAVTGFILQPLLYLGGVFFSIKALHPFWQTLAAWNPLVYLVNGVRYGLIGIADVDPIQAVLVSLVTLAVFHAMALRSLTTGSFLRW